MDCYTEVSDFKMVVREGDTVTVTDPCYDKGTWCTVTAELPPGEYSFAADIVETVHWGSRVDCSYMFNPDKVSHWMLNTYRVRRECLGEAGVDAGLCGYFIDKPDFDDDRWHELCETIRDQDLIYALPEFANGFFTDSGYGDGGYDVFLLRAAGTNEVVGLSIVFIESDEEDEEDDE